MDEQSGDLIEHYKALIDELDEKNKILEATLREKNNQTQKLQEQCEDILKNIKEKEARIVDLEFELISVAQNQSGKLEPEEKMVDYVNQLKEKDAEIEKLNMKLLKRNCDLQGLVNNELWEKNREIEKLQKKQSSKLIQEKDLEIEKLQSELTTKEKQFGLIKQKITELGIEVDVENGDVNIDKNLQQELEKSEKLRLEANEVCGVLSRRLEELAIFLDSLLKQKSILGFLGNKENKRLRQIIDQSLDLSRTFTMSMIINPDQSLLQLTNISSILNDENVEDNAQLSLVPSNLSLTYKSHLYKKDSEESSQIIQTLREQIVNLKYELQLRDVELNKMNTCIVTEASSDKEDEEVAKSNLNTTSTTLKYKSDNQSESEAWSEPDRVVSRARMGLNSSIRSNNSRKVGNTSTESTEDEMNSSMRSKRSILNESRTTILDLHKQVCELDQKLSEKEIAYYDMAKNNTKLKQDVAIIEAKLEETEKKLKEAEINKKEAQEKVEQLQREKDSLLEIMTKKDKELEDKINQLEVEKCEALEAAKKAEEAAVLAKNEMVLAESKLREIQQQMSEIRGEFEDKLRLKLKDMEDECLTKMTEIETAAEIEIKTLHNTIQQLHNEYSTNYVKKCKLEEAVAEIQRLKNNVEVLEDQIVESQRDEDECRQTLHEYETRINTLRNDLDNATLQYSEAVLEKTKMANEKALIEQELSRSVLKEVDMKKRLDQVENELSDLKQNHQKQISTLETHKSTLEMRVSELESSNAELHNRLIKIQAGCGDHLTSSSLPNTPNFVNQIVSFRRQNSENSGYLSDHIVLEEAKGSNRSFGRLAINQNFDMDRLEANSSPDLGIESDHGRFSSLETQVQRPLLQTLELTESMNNLLDEEANNVAVGCDNAHCCQKTMEMAHENSDLKRKLLRTRRALEETVTQLTLANQRKKQVEKTICRQIHKTSQVLRKAKANLDSGSETDVYKK